MIFDLRERLNKFQACVKNVSLAYSKSLDGRYGENDEWLQCLQN